MLPLILESLQTRPVIVTRDPVQCTQWQLQQQETTAQNNTGKPHLETQGLQQTIHHQLEDPGQGLNIQHNHTHVQVVLNGKVPDHEIPGHRIPQLQV